MAESTDDASRRMFGEVVERGTEGLVLAGLGAAPRAAPKAVSGGRG
jgi:hypothetical protein